MYSFGLVLISMLNERTFLPEIFSAKLYKTRFKDYVDQVTQEYIFILFQWLGGGVLLHDTLHFYIYLVPCIYMYINAQVKFQLMVNKFSIGSAL